MSRSEITYILFHFSVRSLLSSKWLIIDNILQLIISHEEENYLVHWKEYLKELNKYFFNNYTRANNEALNWRKF